MDPKRQHIADNVSNAVINQCNTTLLPQNDNSPDKVNAVIGLSEDKMKEWMEGHVDLECLQC